MTNEGKPEVAAAGEPAPTKEPPETGALLRRFAAEAAHMLDWLAQFGSGANADEGLRGCCTPRPGSRRRVRLRSDWRAAASPYPMTTSVICMPDWTAPGSAKSSRRARTSIRSSAEDVTTARTALWRAPRARLFEGGVWTAGAHASAGLLCGGGRQPLPARVLGLGQRDRPLPSTARAGCSGCRRRFACRRHA